MKLTRCLLPAWIHWLQAAKAQLKKGRIANARFARQLQHGETAGLDVLSAHAASGAEEVRLNSPG